MHWKRVAEGLLFALQTPSPSSPPSLTPFPIFSFSSQTPGSHPAFPFTVSLSLCGVGWWIQQPQLGVDWGRKKEGGRGLASVTQVIPAQGW